MTRGSPTAGIAAGIAVAILLVASGCADSAAPQSRPISIRLIDIQSGTVRVNLHQVVEIDIGDSTARYTAEIADPGIVSVVDRRDGAHGRFEPELVPLRLGATQVDLISSIQGQEIVGFQVVVSRDGSSLTPGPPPLPPFE